MPTRSENLFDICIVSWRTRELLRQCLESVVGQSEVARVTVVDNASGDGTVEMVKQCFSDVTLIANTENIGFAAANNQAIRAGSAPFVLLLNPDTRVQPGALSMLQKRLDEAVDIGAVAPQLVLPDGRVQRSCRSFPTPAAVLLDALGLWRIAPANERFGAYRMTYWGHDSSRDVDQPMASALGIRRRALDEVGLFDEDFPLYFNDVDLCYRLREAGWRIAFEPAAKVLHHHGQSTWQVRPAAVLESHRSLRHFYRKHYRGKVGWWGYWAVFILAWLTMYPRAALGGVLQQLRQVRR
ncbi:MAG: glycosyltransferase family 2 protein [Armatimonadetes bacterium]|nr:glycosyltransferase family 2 protein [Armatimonadota bacterium]